MKYILLLLLFFCSNAFGALTDIKFGQYQIADSQWNVSACLNTTTCQIYSKNPGIMYKIPWTAGQWSWQTGQYVQFTLTGNASFPYEGKVYNSNGTLAGTIGTGKIVNMGPDYFFFVGNDNNTGQLFSGSSGMSNTSGVSWTGALNPTIQQADTYANSTYSTVPLTAGQTATSTPSNAAPPPPTYGTNFTRVTSYEWKTYAAGSQPLSQEQAHEAFDGNNGSKWFGLRSQGAWAVVQFVIDGTYSSTRAVQKIQFVTANDGSNRDPTGFIVWGSINGTDWVLVSQQAISLPTSRYAESTVYSLNNVTAFSYYKIEFTGVRDGGDAFQVAEIRLIYDVDDPQGTLAGGGVYTPPLLCCGGSAAAFNSSVTNTAKVQAFVNRTTADSQVFIEQIGNSNTIEVVQRGTRNNYTKYQSNGSFNNTVITQTSTNTTATNYTELTLNGNNNDVIITQQSTGGTKGAFVNISNNSNSLMLQQKDSGNHYTEISLSGSNKNVEILQQGSASHMARIGLTGLATDLSLTQSGSTQNFYSINFNCATAGGCPKITVTQGQ